jgi:Zn-dependent protease
LIFGALNLAQILARAVALLIAFSIHECAHAWTAFQLGDPTAKYQGRMTLDPRAHLDPIGTIMVLLVGFGWAKPVPVNPYNLRYGPVTGMALVSASGPLSNLLLAMIFAIPFHLNLIPYIPSGPFIPSIPDLILVCVILNIVLMVFNLLPIAPLDGFSVAMAVLPRQWSYELARLEQYGPAILLLLIVLGSFGRLNLLGLIMGPPINLLSRLILGF